MSEFLLETHCHTSETSRCGKVSANQLVELYIQSGYAGIVITDHMNSAFHGIENETWEDKINSYLTGYRAAKMSAKGRIDILLGMELTFENSSNDFLIYGLTEELIYKYNNENTNFRAMGIKNFSDFAKKSGLIMFQAHPFRNGMTVVKPVYLEGIEVYNGNPRHDSRNDIAKLWAKKFGLKTIGGSDFHQVEDLARGGIITDYRISDNNILLDTIVKGSYKIKKTEDEH